MKRLVLTFALLLGLAAPAWAGFAEGVNPEQYRVLRAVAQLRAHREGGTTSVSAVIRDLVDANIDELRAEAKPLLDIG